MSFDVRYKPRNAIKRQVLADFVVEFTPTVEDAHRACQVSVWAWKVYVDRWSNAWGSGIGMVLELLEGIRVEHSLGLGFQASNNKVEHEAMLDKL